MTNARRWAVFAVALAPWAVASYFAPPTSLTTLLIGAVVSFAATYFVTSIGVSSVDDIPELTETTSVTALQVKPAIFESQKLAVLSRLQQSLVRLNTSRKETELAGMKLGECARRVDLLRRAQYEFMATQISPRLSKNAVVPETFKALDIQQSAEVQRMVVLLQFHDALEQNLSKIEKDELQAAIGLLEPNICQPEQTEKGPAGSTMTTMTPVRRQQVELL